MATMFSLKRATGMGLVGPICALWVGVIVLGTWGFASYDGQPGASGSAPEGFPGGSRIVLDSGRATLILFGHPRCPCTRASLEELATLLTRARGKVSTFIEFLQPEGQSDEWSRKELWAQAASLPGVHVALDSGGTEARRFGARTSGQVLLFDTSGKLRFSGGITGARGHRGDNRGLSTVLAILLEGHGHSRVDTAPVFGCALTRSIN